MRIDYYLTDVHTGLIGSKIDLGSTSWNLSVNDSSLSTIKSRKVGVDEVSQVDVSWDAVPGNTPRQKYESIEPGRKAIAGFSLTDDDIARGNMGVPFIWGAITNHSPDTRSGTSITLSSVYAILDNRYVIREGDFTNNRAKNLLGYSGMSMRGLAAEVGYICTNQKPGGSLPVDWNYRGEKHITKPGENSNLHTRNYWAWNVQNLSGADVFDKLAGVSDGVDMQWRPYLADDNHVRLSFVAGSDEERYLAQAGRPLHLHSFNGGGNLSKPSVAYAQPIHRWYGTGAGEDAEILTYSAEDLSLIRGSGQYMLRESAFSDSDDDRLELLKPAVDGKLDAWRTPIMQLSGTINLNDEGIPQLGLLHPGELVYVDLYDFPSLPSQTYPMRLMNMSSNGGNTVNVVFDVITVPYFN